jgi:hypothetical protein
MKGLTPKILKILTFTGLFFLTIPISILGLWVHAFNLGDTQTDRVAIFDSYFPDYLQGRWDTTLISIAFCVLAIVLSSFSLTLSEKLWKILNIIIVAFSILLLLLNLFSMM